MTEPTPPASRLIKHSSIYAIGTVSRQLVSFIMLPVYTRFMSPADYGVVGLLTFTLALVEPFLGARLGDAIPKFYFESEDSTHRTSVFTSAFVLTGLISGLTALAIYLVRDDASALLFGTTKFGLVVGIFGIQILTQGVEYYGLTFIRIRQKPYLFITVSLLKLILQLSLNIWLIVFLKMGVMGVVVSGAISSSIFAGALTIYIFFVLGFRFDLGLSKKMLMFSWPLWFSGLAGLYILQSNRYYIRIFGSLDHIGLFELAFKFASILTMLIWNPFSQVWDVERFLLHKRPNSAKVFSDVFRVVVIVLVATSLGISIFATPTIQIMSAEPFHRASISVPFLTLATVFFSLTIFLNFGFLVSGQTKRISWNNYATMAGVTVFNVALIPKFAEVGAAIALVLAAVMQYILTERTSRKFFDMKADNVLLVRILAVAIIAYLIAEFIMISTNLLINLALSALVYLAFLGFIARLLWKDPSSRKYLQLAIRPVMTMARRK